MMYGRLTFSMLVYVFNIFMGVMVTQNGLTVGADAGK
jgi:hypothetical protein